MNPGPLLSFIPQEILHDWLNRPRRVFKKGEYILAPGDEKAVYILMDGTAQLFHLHPNGKECVIDLLGPGECVGLPDLFSKRDPKRFARALTRTDLIPLTIAEVRETVMQHPSLAVNLLEYITEQLEETWDILEQVAYGKVEERLRFLLNKWADPEREEKGYFPLPDYLTHRDLAGMIASTRETVTFLMNKLLHEGVVMQKENRLWLKKAPGM